MQKLSYIKVPIEFIELSEKKYNSADILLLSFLKTITKNGKVKTEVSNKYIADNVGLVEATVSVKLGAFEEVGFIKRSRGKYSQRAIEVTDKLIGLVKYEAKS